MEPCRKSIQRPDTPKPAPQPVQQQSHYRVGAICRDGWQSHATGREACSHHGGVSEWLYE